MKASTGFRRSHITALLGLSAIALVAAGEARGEHHINPLSAGGGGAVLGCLAVWGMSRRGYLRDSNPDDNGGGGALSQAQFQQRTLEAIKTVRDGQKTITDNIATLDREGKQLSEDFSKHCKEFEGLPSQVEGFQLSLQKLELKIANERRASFGSAIDMIRMNEEINQQFNAIVRGTLSCEQKRFRMNDGQKSAWDQYKKAMSEGTSPGSTYINDALYTAIYSLIAEHGVWSQFDVIPASTKTTKLLVDSTDMVMGVVDENTEPGEGAYTGQTISATVKKLLGWIGVSNELLEDSEIDLSGHVLMKFARATGFRLDYFCLSATGVVDATNGGFTGIFQGGTAAVAAATHTTAATLTYEDYLKTMLAVNATVLSRPGTRWWMHPQNLVRTLLVKDLNGRPMFLPAIDAPAPGALGSILGYPVTMAHAAPNTDAASAKVATFGDPQGNAVLLRKDLEVATSEQVKFLEDKTVFRARARAASKIKDATAFGVLTTAAA